MKDLYLTNPQRKVVTEDMLDSLNRRFKIIKDDNFDLNDEFSKIWTNGHQVKNAPANFDIYALYIQFNADEYNLFEIGWGSKNQIAYRTRSGNPLRWSEWKIIG